jgi:outer membrane protein assembly factor BamB
MRLKFALLLLAAPILFSEDWPQWRGPMRDGSRPSFHEPKVWPEKLYKKWTIPIGQGHSSPIFADGRIYVLSRQQDKEVISAILPEDGKILWSQSYAAPYKMNEAAVKHGEGPKSTPVFADGSVYTLGISGILSCLNAVTGEVRWRKEFSKEFRQTSPIFGTAMSPLVDNGLLIAHVGGNDDGALTAFDTETGDVKWAWKGDGPGYSSPVIAAPGGVRQVVTQTQQNIVGVDEASGELLWQIPFSTPYVQNIVTPIFFRSTLIYSGLSKGITGATVTKSRGQWSNMEMWSNQEVSMYMSSPVLAGNLMFGFSHKNKGQFFCLDANTGKTLWLSDPRQGDNAAILQLGQRLVLLKDDGELIIAQVSAKGFEPIRRYKVADSPTWAHPLALETGIVIKDADSLTFWRF